MNSFSSLGLSEALLNSLGTMGYSEPTPIQAQTIPAALTGQDVLGTAQTGTGKTAAYGIPLVSHLLNSPTSSALVLVPTRELANQVLELLKQILGKKSGIRTSLIIGGDSMSRQLQELHAKPRLIVGTPGRLNDHLDRGTLKLDAADFLVLDETDRMLDMGFGIQLEQIAKSLPAKRQTLMFSATLPHNILKLSDKYLKNAVRVSIGSTIMAADTVKQEIIRTSEADKHDQLIAQLELREGTFVVFVGRKTTAERLANKLQDQGHSADAIHGDLRQRNREKVIRGFRNQKYRILVATDVAARGLDIPHIECVVNYDLPQCEEDFIHRIGRTGRAGAQGTAVSLITPQDHAKWRSICKMMDPNAKVDASFADPKGGARKNGGSSSSNRKPGRFGGSAGGRSEGGYRPRSDDGYSPRSSEGFRPRSEGGRSEALIFQPRSSEGFRPRSAEGFRPRSDDGFKPRSSEGFRPRGEGGFKPRTEGGFIPRSNDGFKPRSSEGFRPRSDDGFKPRSSEGFRPRSDDGFKPRSSEGFKPRGEGGFKPRSSEGFRPRSDDGFKPRSSEGFKPRGEGGFKPRSSEGFRPRSDDGFKPRSSEGFKPRGEGGFKPRTPGSDSRPTNKFAPKQRKFG